LRKCDHKSSRQTPDKRGGGGGKKDRQVLAKGTSSVTNKKRSKNWNSSQPAHAPGKDQYPIGGRE